MPRRPVPRGALPQLTGRAARTLIALAAFPLGWGVREAAGGTAGGAVVLGAIAACAVGIDRRATLRLIAIGLLCFVAVHLVAALTAVWLGLATGALAFASIVSRAWRTPPTARPAAPAA